MWRYTVWIIAIGGTIAFLTAKAGFVFAGIAIGVITLAVVCAVVLLRMRDLSRMRARTLQTRQKASELTGRGSAQSE